MSNISIFSAPLHPWNIIKQDKETISFVIFVYAVALSLILIRLCSFWNFVSFAAVGYTSYVLGGPKFCFRWYEANTSLVCCFISITCSIVFNHMCQMQGLKGSSILICNFIKPIISFYIIVFI